MKVSPTDPEGLVRLLEGDLSADEKRRMIRHMLMQSRTGMGRAEIPRLDTRPAGPAAPTDGVEDLGQLRLNSRALDLLLEKARVPHLIARLEGRPLAERQHLVRTEQELQSSALAYHLIEICHDLLHGEMARAEELAELAVTLSQELDTRRYGSELVNDVKARAWACLAEVLRSRADLRNADEALGVAESLLSQGTGDVLDEARLLELKAVLRRDQNQLDQAHAMLDEVIAIYRQYRDFHLVGRALVQKGSVYGASGDFEPAVRWLRKGLGLIDPTRERRLDLSARHSLMLYLHESGRNQEAWFLLKASRAEFVEHGGELLRLRLRWLEGKIQQALGHLGEAEEALTQARRGFLDQGAGFSAALVCLDLAGLYASQSRAGEVRRLAEEMLPIFQARDIHREAMAALIVFQQAVRMEKLSIDLLDEIRVFLRRARTDPKLRFEYSA